MKHVGRCECCGKMAPRKPYWHFLCDACGEETKAKTCCSRCAELHGDEKPESRKLAKSA